MLLKFASAAVLLIAALPAAAQIPRDSIVARLDRNFRRFEAHGFAGTVAIADSAGILLQHAYGLRDRERRLPAELTTLYDVASVDKTFIATLILALESRGHLRLNDDLARFFPELRPPHSAITVRQLLSHSSGLVRDYESRRDGALDSREKVITVMQGIGIDTASEKRFDYSNLGYNVLKAVAEVAAGRDYKDTLMELVLAPAGVQAVFSPFARPIAAAAGYRGPIGAPVLVDSRSPGVVGETYAGGTPYVTVPDILRWLVALRDGRILSDSSVSAMLRVQHGDYGFGWFVYPGQLNVTGGDTEGYQTTVLFHRPSGMIVVAATNMRSDDRRAWWRGAITKSVQLTMRGRDYNPPPAPASANITSLAGTYRFTSGAELRLTANGDALVAVPDGQEAIDALSNRDSSTAAAIRRVSEAAGRVAEAMTRGDSGVVRTLLRDDIRETGFGRFAAIWREADSKAGGFRSHRVLGVVATSGRVWQSYLELRGATRADTLRILWSPESVRMEGWGLGGGDPVAMRFIPSAGNSLAAFVPAEDETIMLEVVRNDRGRIVALRTAAGQVAMRK